MPDIKIINGDCMAAMPKTYIYGWKNNSKRRTLYARKCKLIKRLKMNSAAVKFENGQFEVISRNALRKDNKCKTLKDQN